MPLFSKHNYAIMLRLYRILSFPMNFLLQTSKQPQLVAQGAESIFLKSQSWKVEEFVQYQHRSTYFSFPPKFNIVQMFQLLFLKKEPNTSWGITIVQGSDFPELVAMIVYGGVSVLKQFTKLTVLQEIQDSFSNFANGLLFTLLFMGFQSQNC